MKNSEMYAGFKFAKPITLKKQPKQIPKISEKKKERITKQSEIDFFCDLAIERSENWIVYAKDIKNIMKAIKLTDLQPINFSHILPKGKYPKLRYDKDNIEIVTFAYHFLEHTWLNYKWPELKN